MGSQASVAAPSLASAVKFGKAIWPRPAKIISSLSRSMIKKSMIQVPYITGTWSARRWWRQQKEDLLSKIALQIVFGACKIRYSSYLSQETLSHFTFLTLCLKWSGRSRTSSLYRRASTYGPLLQCAQHVPQLWQVRIFSKISSDLPQALPVTQNMTPSSDTPHSKEFEESRILRPQNGNQSSRCTSLSIFKHH